MKHDPFDWSRWGQRRREDAWYARHSGKFPLRDRLAILIIGASALWIALIFALVL